MTVIRLARWVSIGAIALLSSLIPWERACAQGGGRGVITASAYVVPLPRPDTIPATRMPEWRSSVLPTELVLTRGTMVRDTVAGDERRRLILAYVGN